MTDLISREAAAAICDEAACETDSESARHELFRARNAIRTLPAVQPSAQCCMCGKTGLDTTENGGSECQLSDKRWTCSRECYYRAVDMMPGTLPAVQPDALPWRDINNLTPKQNQLYLLLDIADQAWLARWKWKRQVWEDDEGREIKGVTHWMMEVPETLKYRADINPLPAVQPDAASIREAALREAADVPGSWARTFKRKAERTVGLESAEWLEEAQTLLDIEGQILALINNPGHVKETVKTEHDREDVLTPDAAAAYLALAQGQEPLGSDFEAVWDAHVDILYDNSPREEVMPDEAGRARGSSDTAPAGLSAGGGADYRAVREAIQQMVGLEGEYKVEQESADRALDFLDDMEAKNCPAPRLLVEDGSVILTWAIGGWKLYKYCDEEESQSFYWQGPPATEGGA